MSDTAPAPAQASSDQEDDEIALSGTGTPHFRFRVRDTWLAIRSDAVDVVLSVSKEIPFFVQPETRSDGELAVGFPLLFELASKAAAAGLVDVRVLPQVHKMLGAP